MGNQNTTPFQSLKALPTPLSQSQCVLYKHELLICGGYNQRTCYSYHTIKNEYMNICSYPNNVKLDGHCVVKLIDNNNKDSNEITLLSFGGDKNNRHTLVMKYVSVWSNDNNNDNEINTLNNYNKWIPFTDNHNNPIVIGGDKDAYQGARGLIGGKNNNLLFITYFHKNISVFDLNKFQFIKHDNLPTDYIGYHCFVSKPEMIKNNKNYEMILFCKKTGLSIIYDEDNNIFQFNQLSVFDDISSFRNYAYLCINDIILLFGGIHKYSIRENKWMTFQNTLSNPLCHCVAILNEDNAYIHIIGGLNDNTKSVLTHTKTKVRIELKVKKEENKTVKKEENKVKNDNIFFVDLKLCKCKFDMKEKDEQIRKKEQSENNINDINDINVINIFSFVFFFVLNIYLKKKGKNKWMEWWNQREQKDKTEIIEKFKIMSNEQFGLWLLNECKWKNEITKDDIDPIRFLLNTYISFVITNQDNKEDELIAYVIMDEKKKLIKMKELTFEELLRQTYNCLESKSFQKINKENLKLQLVDIKNNIIESDESVKKEFANNNEPIFKIIWTSFQQQTILGKTKTIKNALVIMIAISEYDDNNIWKNLKNVKEKDIHNFKQLFEQELNYEIVYNQSPKMTKQDVQTFLAKLIVNYELHENSHKYDGLIIIICGHGENGNMLVTSDGKDVSIDRIRSSFNCHEMESFKDFPKIFIIDACRGEGIPKTHEIVKRGNDITYGHNDDGFLVIWSTTKGHQVADLSLLSECMKNVVKSKYKSSYPFKQMLQDIRTEIRSNKSSEWYCVESQDTTDYDIIFQQRKSM
ncbi:hypothetical protein RFI_12261 [Reticulomyxa filosa]|uniref:Caspase family p20 domain-containing protein n=1 Tax=Reticulomyxa filosa TaxID=46433 RepID=X6NF23_RETFI|nr:hypothetical protein RFI_12261 [Reticulomyxa filosa]|eukprot:ETO24895.1 hypothetical protein RFI_12261 [Reticulomyxa filosa]